LLLLLRWVAGVGVFWDRPASPVRCSHPPLVCVGVSTDGSFFFLWGWKNTQGLDGLPIRRKDMPSLFDILASKRCRALYSKSWILRDEVAPVLRLRVPFLSSLLL
jgi:hypothetical protein